MSRVENAFYRSYRNDVQNALAGMLATAANAQTIQQEDAFQLWLELTRTVYKNGRTLFFIGNGASAGMAAHMAADATKNGGFRALNFNDAPLMTAISNDIEYAECFALPLGRFAQPGDLLITISSSGNSENVIRGITTAHELGVKVVTLSGMKSDNRSRAVGDLNFYIPARTYGIVECAHQVLLHCWLDLFLKDNEREV